MSDGRLNGDTITPAENFRSRASRWTADDDAFLRAHAPLAEWSVDRIAAALGSSRATVYRRATAIGVRLIGNCWAPEDDRWLTSHALEWSVSRLAAHLGRSENAVRRRGNKLGLRGEDFRFELTAVQVAEMLLVNERTVRRWVQGGRLAAWRTKPKAPRRIPPHLLRAFLVAGRPGVLSCVPRDLIEILASPPTAVPPALELSIADACALTLARAHEIERLMARKVLAALGVGQPIRTKDLRELAINNPAVIPALRRVPVVTVQLIADLWG